MLLIYSSANGLLGCSNLLATMNSAAMNTDIQISESLFSILWGIHLRLGLLGLMVTYVQLLEEPPKHFPQQLYHFTFPRAMYETVPISPQPRKYLLVF